jgi:proteasome beta subunit
MAVSADGNGVFLPIAASYDPRSKAFGVYFFDLAGARFQSSGYACAGSGSERIRGVFEYLIRIKGPFESRPLDDVLSDDLVMLDIASELDSATGGWRKTLPSVFVLTESGYTEYEQKELSRLVAKL